MVYLYEALKKPTRLYIKQCSHCGLKYFGKSTRRDLETYRGSGTRWNVHLKKHRAKAIHLWNSEWYSDTSIVNFARKFSIMNKIVESNTWANLRIEDGLEGGFENINDGSSAHISRARVGGIKSGGGKKNTSFKKGDPRTRELSRKANDTKRELLMDCEFRQEYYSKVSKYQKQNNSMAGKCWCVPLSCTDKNKEKRVFPVDQIPYGWISCVEFNSLKKKTTHSTYGKQWIFNPSLKINKYVDKTEPIPEGWFKGRKTKF